MSFIFAGAVVFSLGDYLGITSNIPFLLWQVLFGFALVSSIATFFLKFRKEAYLGFTTLFLFAAGGINGMLGATVPSNYIGHFTNNTVSLQGEIVPGTVKKREDGTINLKLAAKVVEVNAKKTNTQGIVNLSVRKFSQNKEFPAYGLLKVRGKLLPITGFANPGVFDSELAAKINNIGGRMTVKATGLYYEPIEKPWLAYIAQVGYAMREKLNDAMSRRDSAVLAGMVLGGYDGIDNDIVYSFSATGIVHILSVSGSHIALLIGFVLAAMNYFKVRQKIAVLVAATVIAGYALLCGFSPPVLRSVLMGISMLAGLSLGKDADRGAVLAGAVLVMLCYKPLWIQDIGFQLSFFSTAGLIYIMPQIRKAISSKLPGLIVDSLAVCLAAQIAVIPFLVYYFHQLSPCSLFANIVVVPLIEILLIITLVGLVLSFILPPMGTLLLIIASFVLGPCLNITKWIASWEWATIAIPKTPIFMAVVYYLALWIVGKFYPLHNLSVKERKICAALCFVVLVLQQAVIYFLPQRFEVYFLDVGQGDSALILTPDKKSILIDTGGFKGNFNTGERIVMPVLRYLGVKKLDVLMLSHGHMDHAGGAARLAQLVPIDTVLLPIEKSSPEVKNLLCSLGEEIKKINMVPGQKIHLENCIIEVIDTPTQIMETDNGNEACAIVRLGYGKNSIVFTGDATGEAEIRASGKNIKAQILKISHHGSPSSSEREFLQAVNPSAAIISVGRNNTFGHPSAEVLYKLQQLNIKTYRTDDLGAIKVVFDGSQYECYSYRYQKECF